MKATWSPTQMPRDDDTRSNRQRCGGVDTGTRGFAGAGQEQFLEPYWLGHSASRQHLDALRHLTADNPNQQRHLDRLEPQISALLGLLTKMVAT
jgi:CHASE3 domain sensor protein